MAVIAGNWKMHLTPSATSAYFDAFELPAGSDGHDVIVFPPALCFAAARAAVTAAGRIALGVQNVHWEAEGAFTGETSAEAAAAAGAAYALVGHSERRHVFGETDAEVARKVGAVRRAGLVPVVCVGETLQERKAGQVDAVILRQLDAALGGLSDGDGGLMVAYEPVWAIGTGETATPSDASDAHGTLRERLDHRLGREASAGVPVLYGGSVKPGNAAELLAAPAVDGVLVGGASLDPADFAAIVAAAS
ncbi:MAG: triose-phosphate isomerase [Longimicrobiales bacterium]